jgi:hypothetical protein
MKPSVIYSFGRPREISRRDWGVEGYRSGTVAAAWKGRVFLHASADEDTPILIERLEVLMKQVASDIPGDSDWPVELATLPAKRFIDGTDRYIGDDLLGHSFLPGGFLANYEMNGSEGLLFLSNLGTPESARRAFDLFSSFENERGKILRQGKIGEASFWAEDPGLGSGVVVLRRAYVCGLWGIKDPRIAKEIAVDLDGRLLSDKLRK